MVCVAQCTSRMSTNSVSSVDLGEPLTQVRFLPIFEYLMCMRGRAYMWPTPLLIKLASFPRGHYSQYLPYGSLEDGL